ncbi:MAG: DUF302 domain-containing protein [candidate division Zixibacteria bacterium]|nr:DUF302 domain-containing protein [candidate division Zixibacteria bacterium]
MINYGFKKEVSRPFGEAEKVVTEELKKKGFGILTKIDVKEKFKEKLGIDFPNYVILGACNPPLAHKAILAEQDIGLLLPCNVVIYEKEGKTVLDVMKPSTAMGMIGNEELRKIATEVEVILKEVFDSVN